jgi:hypothetical protein
MTIDLSNSAIPLRTFVWERSHYDGLDVGIRFAVRVLHARGIETSQSCEGGDGHAYDRPSIDVPAGSRDADGFAAVAALVAHGLDVRRVSQVWDLDALGRPYQTVWRIELRRAVPERADADLMFLWGYQAQPMEGDPT